MSTGSSKEHPSTYFVQDRSNEDELQRLRVQDQMLTQAMGGVLPEQPDLPGIEGWRRVLDVGSGSGDWVIEMARAYPGLQVFGIDISKRMVEHGKERARKEGLAERVEFAVMDALRMLEFPVSYFDLVNVRLSISWLRTWDWPRMLEELQRVTRHGGIVRVTETEVMHNTNSAAGRQWNEMLLCAQFRAGYLFEETTTGLTAHLEPLFKQHGLRDVQTKMHALHYDPGSPQLEAYHQDGQYLFRTLRPFLQKWGCLSPDYDAICKQALQDTLSSDFHSTWNFLTVWGRRP